MVRSLVINTTLNTGSSGNDRVAIGSNATTTTNAGGNLNSILKLLRIIDGGGTDDVYLDDSGDGSANSGTLTDSMITGLGMTLVSNTAALKP